MIKVLVFFALLSSAFGDMTMTEELLMAQNELNTVFEFTELYLINQMTLWIDNITILTEEHILPGFFDAREEILSIIDDTSAYINAFEPSACRDETNRRWLRQVSMIGTRLQFCMREARRIISLEYDDLNLHHPNAQKWVAHVPNQSLNILSQSSFFEPSGTIYRAINRRLRELLGRAAPWLVIMDELEDLMIHHIEQAKTMVGRCYVFVVANFRTEANSYRQRVDLC